MIHPIFVRADCLTSGSWTGYSARVQVRPDPLGTYVWPGGYLSDGTFVQSGMMMPGSPWSQPGEALIFAWATTNTAASDTGPLPLAWVSVPSPVALSWYTFELTKVGRTWRFRYRDPAGAWHAQGSFARAATLFSFQIAAEYWADGPSAFATQAMQHAWVLSGARWGPTSMAYAPNEEQRGHETIQSVVPGNAVFRAVEAPGPAYKVLW